MTIKNALTDFREENETELRKQYESQTEYRSFIGFVFVKWQEKLNESRR